MGIRLPDSPDTRGRVLSARLNYAFRRAPSEKINKNSNDRRLRSAGDNDRRSKRFCFNAVLSVSFT